MTTFFPHLYEYGRIVNLLKELEEKDIDKNQVCKILPATNTLKILPSFNQYYQSKDIEFLMHLELKAQKLRESTYNPINFIYATIETILKERTELSNANKYLKPTEWPLTDEQLAKRFDFPREIFAKHWAIIDFIICIEIAKTLPFFTGLNIADQEAVLKSTTLLNASFTQAYYSFTLSCDALIFPDGSMPIKRPIVHSFQRDIFERVVEPVKRIKMTTEEFVLLKTIIFCSASKIVFSCFLKKCNSESDEISVEGKEILENEFHRYSRLLLNHMQAKYGDAPGAVRYSQILSVMEAMIYFTQKGKEFYMFLGTLNPKFSHALPLVDQVIINS